MLSHFPRYLFLFIVLSRMSGVSLPIPFSSTSDANWPQFRGSNAAGVSDQLLPAEFGPDKNVRWKVKVLPGHASPVVWGTYVFISGFERDPARLVLLALDAATGAERWKRIIPAAELEKTHPAGNPAMSTPCADGERVYVYFGSVGLFAYSFDGTPVWNYRLPLPKMGYGAATSPVVIGESLLLNRDEQRGGTLIALNRKTGQEVWKTANPWNQESGSGESYATPVLWKGHIILHRCGEVVAHDPSNGRRVWWVKLPTSGTSTPAATDEMLFVATWLLAGEPDQLPPLPSFSTLLKDHDKDKNGSISYDEFPEDLPVAARPGVDPKTGGAVFLKQYLEALDPTKDGRIVNDDWKAIQSQMANVLREHGMVAIKPGGRGDVTGSHVVWREKRSVPEVPSPVVVKDQVYMIRNGGVLTAMKAKSGDVVYRTRIGAPGPYFASLIDAGGNLLATSGEGKMTVIRPGAKLEVMMQTDFGEPIFATSALAGGILFVRTAENLYAFGN